MGYEPKSEDQLAKEGLMPDGIYDYEVVDTSDKPSKAGNMMFTLKLSVFDASGDPVLITDYIALGSNFGERKLRHAADSADIITVYESGKLVPADFKGLAGKVEIKTQNGTPEYPLPKNVVKDYVKRPTKESVETGATGAPPSSAAALDDEIPF